MNTLVHISAEAFKGEGRSESYFIWSCDKRDLSMTRALEGKMHPHLELLMQRLPWQRALE